jgi:cytochrome P450
MFIPKDSTVFIGVWAIHHSDSDYKDPDKFNPDRFDGYNKLANDYAGSSDWAGRDKNPLPSVLYTTPKK